jgi:hypothetical protein
MTDIVLEVPDDDLYDVYKLLAEATMAAAAGNPNKCASLAADAKERVMEIHDEVPRK